VSGSYGKTSLDYRGIILLSFKNSLIYKYKYNKIIKVIFMTVIKVVGKLPKLRNAILIEGLPGVGNIGRVAVGYLVEELKAKKFAELYSKWFFPFVMLHDKYKIHLLKNEFFYWKAKKGDQRDLVFLVGDCQSLSPQGHYEVCEKILDLAEKLNVKEVFTIGGLATGELEGEEKIIGAVTDKKLLDRYKKFNIDFNAGEKVGYIVGAAGLLLGLWKERNKDGLCLLGQTTGFPIVTDPKAAERVLDTLTKMLNLKVDMTKLEKRVKEMENFIKKVEALQKRALMDITKATGEKKPGEEQLRYIG
jgi:hypothetical protein